MASVQVWSSQLAHNDFPPVCAMTGRPAETWRKFTFSTPPVWTYALLALVCLGGIGIILFAIVVYAVSEKAVGYLPLTRRSNQIAALAQWIPVVLLLAWPATWVAGFIFGSSPDSGSTFAIFFFAGLFFMVAGLIGRLLLKPMVSPRGKVYAMQPGQFDRLVEMSNVSPAFALAVRQAQEQRMTPVSNPPEYKVN